MDQLVDAGPARRVGRTLSLCFSEGHVDQLVDAGPARRLGWTLSLSVSVKATWISWLMQGQRAVWDGLCLSLFQ